MNRHPLLKSHSEINLTTSYINSTNIITFPHPTTILIAGPSQAGKTFFFKQVLEHQLIQPSPSRVIYVYVEHAPDLADLKPLYPSIEYVQGMKNFLDVLPTIELDERNLVVLDDQMSEAGKLEETSNLFTKWSHITSKHYSGLCRSKCL